ncbi:hypothetical protein MHYP_G00298180 [Metynnis hypsauchen]
MCFRKTAVRLNLSDRSKLRDHSVPRRTMAHPCWPGISKLDTSVFCGLQQQLAAQCWGQDEVKGSTVSSSLLLTLADS